MTGWRWSRFRRSIRPWFNTSFLVEFPGFGAFEREGGSSLPEANPNRKCKNVMPVATDDIPGWVLGRLPEGWFVGPAQVDADDDEILIVGALDEARAADEGHASLIQQFRAETREQRMRIAQEAERRFGRKVAWGVTVGGERTLFTTLSIPVMTRLRLSERQVLDTLVQAGVARSRSEALAWCVRLVGRHEAEWISELRDALVRVNELRRRGPT